MVLEVSMPLAARSFGPPVNVDGRLRGRKKLAKGANRPALRTDSMPYLSREPGVLVPGLEQLAPVGVELGVQQEVVDSHQGLELHLLLLQLGELRGSRGLRSLLLQGAQKTINHRGGMER